VFVACSTLCYSQQPLDTALRRIADLEFSKYELALVEGGQHLAPSDVGDQFDAILHRLRSGPSLTPSSLYLDFGPVDSRTLTRRFTQICRLAKPLTVAVLVIRPAAEGTPFEEEVRRLGALCEIAHGEGLILSVANEGNSIVASPAAAVALCQAVPGLGLTLDPSHFLHGSPSTSQFDEVSPFVQNVHFRDTGKKPGEFQVRIGQGQIEYGRVISQLERHGYNRGLTVTIRDDLDSPFEVEVEVRKLKLLLESLI
jgi:sugar phosphate isomerase/epimerase